MIFQIMMKSKDSVINKDSILLKIGLKEGNIMINNSILSSYSNTLKVYCNMENINNTKILKNNEVMELNYEINQ